MKKKQETGICYLLEKHLNINTQMLEFNGQNIIFFGNFMHMKAEVVMIISDKVNSKKRITTRVKDRIFPKNKAGNKSIRHKQF